MGEQVYGKHAGAWMLAGALALAAAGCGKPAAPPAQPPVSAQVVDTAIQSAESYLAAQKPREAVQVAARLAQEAPTLMRVHEIHARALVALALDRETTPADRQAFLGQAADAYDRAAALDSTNAALQHAAGVVSDTAGRAAAARAHYQAAHEAEPGNAQYLLYLGSAVARAGDLDGALPLLQQAAKASPSSPDPRAALADLYVRRGDLQAARAAIQEARRLAPGSLELRLADARMRRLDKHPEETLDLLMALDPPVQAQPGVAEELALAHLALGDVLRAAQALEASAHAAPDDWRRARRASQAWLQAGDPVRAEMWERAAQGAGAPSAEPAPAVQP
ncbi:MAG: tetratricopeptide repeat protein [Phycisphaerales bacterium]